MDVLLASFFQMLAHTTAAFCYWHVMERGQGLSPVPDLTNTLASSLTYVSTQLTEVASTSGLLRVNCYFRIVWVLPQVPCSFALWYNSYIPACLIAPRRSCVYALRMCPRCSYDRESVYALSPEPLITLSAERQERNIVECGSARDHTRAPRKCTWGEWQWISLKIGDPQQRRGVRSL